MYRLGERTHGRRKFWLKLAGFAVIAAAAVLVTFHLLKPNTNLGKPTPAVTTKIASNLPPAVTVQEPLFSLSLPEDWQPRVNNDLPKPTYSWHGTTTKDNTRWINLYVDSIPTSLAVNRLVPIESGGSTISLITDVSDNCINYTGYPSGSEVSVLAKWQGVNFLCDTGNYTRDVVGTGSADGGVNTVVLSSADEGSHRFFFTYTDNSPNPDYTVFTDALKSFHLK